MGDAGNDVGIVLASEDTKANGEVTVEETQAEYDVFVRDTNEPVAAGETLDVVIDVKNTGNGAGEKKVTLDFDQDGNIDDQQFVKLDPGEEKQITLQYDVPSDQSTGDYTVEAASPDTSDTETVSVQQPTDFSVSIDTENTPSEIVEGEEYDVVVTVSNGGGSGTETVDLDVGVLGGETRDVTLDSGESRTITLTYASKDGDAGSYSPAVSAESDSDGTSLTILEDPNFQVTSLSTNSPITEAETLEVTAEIQNTGEVEGTQTVALDFDDDGSVEDTVDLTLGAGATDTVTLTYDAQQGDKGDRDVEVSTEDDVGTTTVEVREDMADRVTYMSGSADTGGDDEAVIFDLRNDGEYDVVVTDFRVEGNFGGVEGEPVEIDKQGGGAPGSRPEVVVDVFGSGTDGTADTGDAFAFGAFYGFADYGSEPQVGVDAVATFTFEQFRTSGGDAVSWNSVQDGSESSYTLKITITFEDGSSKTIYIDADLDN
nr:CARDB domain-containing protein [Halorubellus sp. JP-L1]